MRKKIYKFVSVAVIAVAMVVSFQMSKANSESTLTMENIEALAMADLPEGGSLFNYEEVATTVLCFVSDGNTLIQGTYYMCTDGDEWFCNKGCYLPGESPA